MELEKNQDRLGVAAIQKSIRLMQKRLTELERLIQCAYEDKVMGKIPEEICISLLSRYQSEQTEKMGQMKELKEQLKVAQTTQDGVKEWAVRIRQCRDMDTLDRDVLLRLIDRIEVGDVKDSNGQKEREIRIYYKFVGYIG